MRSASIIGTEYEAKPAAKENFCKKFRKRRNRRRGGEYEPVARVLRAGKYL
jgi:hypothetical protein